MSETIIRILLADDHVLVRKGIVKILEEAFPASVFGEASDAAQTLDLARREKWDIAILDLSMPGRSGFDLINDLKQMAPALPLLVLSMYPAEQVALRAFKAGAAGYLTKESVAGELETAIRKIIAGKNTFHLRLQKSWPKIWGGKITLLNPFICSPTANTRYS